MLDSYFLAIQFNYGTVLKTRFACGAGGVQQCYSLCYEYRNDLQNTDSPVFKLLQEMNSAR